ncbi:hypothetical protein [Longimicrobium sp.]|jgi:hypothetical protein|uniref:hypothetical protein n=1 Tax=Longimicrobium sp. TaxID=2029185 RepID=UPI002ED8A430
MRTIVRILLLACAVVVWAGDPAGAQDRESAVPPADSAARARVDEIRAYTYARALYAHPGRGLRIYARAPGTQRVVSVPDTAVWPESGGWPGETAVSYSVISDSAGRIVGITEFPHREKNEPDDRYIHYFDGDGRLVAFDRLSTFSNGCPSRVRERTISYFDAGGGLLAREYSLEDMDYEPVDPASCTFPPRHEYRIYQTRDEMLQALGIPR